MDDFRSGFGPHGATAGQLGERQIGEKRGDDRGAGFQFAAPVTASGGGAPEGSPETEGSPEKRAKRQPVLFAPAVIKWLLLGFWGVYFFFVFAPRSISSDALSYLALSPSDLFASDGSVGSVEKAAGLIGHMFVHSGLQHIGTNSLLFLAFGIPVIRRLAMAGRPTPLFAEMLSAHRAAARASFLFLAFFLLAGAAGALAFAVLYSNSSVLLVGASGGVSGLFGALVRLINRRGAQFAPGKRPLASLADPVVLILTALFVVVNIAQGVFGFGLNGQDVDIAWEAHLGGYFFGLIAFPFFDALSRPGTRPGTHTGSPH